ncbi:MAG: S-layer homology domain-containing protein [Oscillospiraceae bacterium]|nr:S-layer homology domain-containing protein [Oscillospiraceae bacterium]
MKKRLLSMLMAVLMIASLVPATAMAAPVVDKHVGHDVLTVNITADPAKKQPGIKFTYCNTCANDGIATTDPIIEDLVVTEFAVAGDVCDNHKAPAIYELQKASCDHARIYVTYCSACGMAVNVGDNSSLVIDNTKMGHVYNEFKVVQKPTCNMVGWGYTVCDKCGEAAFVYGAGDEDTAGSALYYLYLNKDGQVKTSKANDVAKMFAKTNENHTSNDTLTTPAANVYENVWVADGNGTNVGHIEKHVKYYAEVKATHAATVSACVRYIDGELTKMPFDDPWYFEDEDKDGNGIYGEGVVGSIYCTDCGEVINKREAGEPIDGLNFTHANMMSKTAGYLPYMTSQGVKVDGKTDTYFCTECGNFGGDKIPYDSFFVKAFSSENSFKTFQNLLYYLYGSDTYGYTTTDKVVVGAQAATCTTKSFTGDTYMMVKNDQGVYAWTKVADGTYGNALGHDLKAVDSKEATCKEIGWTVKDYYVCAREGCNYHQGICTMEAQKEECNYQPKEVIANTCTSEGMNVFACKDCGALASKNDISGVAATELVNVNGVAVKYLPKAPHVAAAELKDAKEATCTEVGYTGDKVCKWCGIVMEKGKEIPMKEHTPEEVAAVAATCTETGLTAGSKCSVCGEVLTAQEVVPALGHKYENGVCTVCGEKDPNYVEPVAPEFKDADSIKDYAKDAVAWAAKEGVVKGDDQGNFNPTANITRQDFVTMLWRLMGETASDKELTFGDKADIKDYAQVAVAWAVENGYITGRDNGNFDPAAKITRAEIVAILNRVADNAKAEKAASFTDIGSHWAKDAIAWAAEAGIVNGVGNDLFAPNDNATRQDTVVMLYKFVNLK